jgi:hypothetical protein
MGFTAIPGGDIWLQIVTTQTPTSGSSVSFTSIPPVKKLRLCVQNVALTTAGVLDITFNNDSGTNYYQTTLIFNGTSTSIVAGQNAFIDTTRAAGAGVHLQDFVVDYANQACPKLIEGFGSNNGSNAAYYGIVANYNSTTAINRVDFTTANTFNATNTGTIAIYGAF